jgi:hypothetical protein
MDAHVGGGGYTHARLFVFHHLTGESMMQGGDTCMRRKKIRAAVSVARFTVCSRPTQPVGTFFPAVWLDACLTHYNLILCMPHFVRQMF